MLLKMPRRSGLSPGETRASWSRRVWRARR
jgi:hypothetical protein